ncbi:MAG: DUF4476 domain-containing protein [Bacteroidetes bacterium]|nr:DUF4476 domain-containing protein [Bacteroidota bacterium]
MKKMLLAIFIGISLQSFALMPSEFSSFEIISGKGNFITGMDGQFFESRGKYIIIYNLTPGYHQLEIFAKQNCNHPNHPGYCQGAKIFASSIFIQPASALRGYIDKQGQFSIIQNVIANPYYGNTYYYQAPIAIAPADFNNLWNTINAQWFDDTRLAVAMQALNTNYLTSNQVTDILNIFWFEQTKLAFAKAAYLRVIDPQNYYVVNNAFWFQSSVQELSAYILRFR